MLAKRIIPCLDVKDGQVVKGVKFKNHAIVGDILELAEFYNNSGADELVFYDIAASTRGDTVDTSWITAIANTINIPFCVAGGIKTVAAAEKILNAGADKISINSPALENPQLINDLVATFGQQCVVIGIDSKRAGNNLNVWQYTGDEETSKNSTKSTYQWVQEVQDRGAGEIVLNCMDSDGVRNGYDLFQLQQIREICKIPLIASGGAGKMEDFKEAFAKTNVDGALAASVFHNKIINIKDLKKYLSENQIHVRP